MEIKYLPGLLQLAQHNNVLEFARPIQHIAMFLSLMPSKIFATLEQWDQAIP